MFYLCMCVFCTFHYKNASAAFFCKNILAIYELIEIMCIEDCKQYFQVTGGKISTVSCNWLAQFCCLVMQVFHRFQKYVPLSSSCLHCFLLYNFFWSTIRIFFPFFIRYTVHPTSHRNAVWECFFSIFGIPVPDHLPVSHLLFFSTTTKLPQNSV